MRILHVSDTHIGYANYGRLNARGFNQREEDVFNAFRQVVDRAIEEKPALVLHTGDLFDSVRPSNRAVTFAMGEIRRLTKAGIPFVAIAGNHESPRLRETGSVFRFLEFIDGVSAVYKGKREVLTFGDLKIHAVPHGGTHEAMMQELREAAAEPGPGINVLATHAGVVGIADSGSMEFNEVVVPESAFNEGFDYIALGHYHRATEVRKNAWYAGSTERMSFNEAGQEKGFLWVDLPEAKVTFEPVLTRDMVTLPAVDCSLLKDSEVGAMIVERIEASEPGGKVVRLQVLNIPRHVYAALDFAKIKRLTSTALHFQVKYEISSDGVNLSADGAAIGALAEEFDRFYSSYQADGLERERLRSIAIQHLGAGVSK
ncbi:MAG: exonuclease SbcCD subunit D [Euryarchaeota archaeon]|nr:exonuclease SbcCD subunit D [Euryarchaeota archaeon]